jgi:hypothetical protein
VNNLSGHLPSYTWAVYPLGIGGWHLSPEHHNTIRLMTGGGVKAWCYLLPHTEQAKTTQFEDMRKLRDEDGVQFLDLRLMHPRHDKDGGSVAVEDMLGTVQARYDLFAGRIERVLQYFPYTRVKLINEWGLELWRVSLSAVYEHAAALGWKLSQAFGNRISIASPGIAPRCPTAQQELAAALAIRSSWDHWCLHVYPRHAAEITAGEWSLPWQLGKLPLDNKPVVIWESGIEKGTSAEIRNQLLPSLWRAIKAAPRVADSYWFIMDAEGQEHQEHFYTPLQIARYLEVIAESTPAPAPTPIPSIPSGTLAEQYPQLWADWVAAGGAENNFRKHLLGIGVITPSKDDLHFLAQEAGASIAQIQGALKRYPF